MREPSATTWLALRRAGALLLLVLWGCASGPAPADHHYRLDVAAPEAPAAKRLDGVLQVDRLRADALAGERDVHVTHSACCPIVVTISGVIALPLSNVKTGRQCP